MERNFILQYTNNKLTKLKSLCALLFYIDKIAIN